jgi:preprotein translocase subunit SecD
MVEKMTAVWLIILTILACAAVPAVLIYTTTMPHQSASSTASTAKMLLGLPLLGGMNSVLATSQ